MPKVQLTNNIMPKFLLKHLQGLSKKHKLVVKEWAESSVSDVQIVIDILEAVDPTYDHATNEPEGA